MKSVIFGINELGVLEPVRVLNRPARTTVPVFERDRLYVVGGDGSESLLPRMFWSNAGGQFDVNRVRVGVVLKWTGEAETEFGETVAPEPKFGVVRRLSESAATIDIGDSFEQAIEHAQAVLERSTQGVSSELALH